MSNNEADLDLVSAAVPYRCQTDPRITEAVVSVVGKIEKARCSEMRLMLCTLQSEIPSYRRTSLGSLGNLTPGLQHGLDTSLRNYVNVKFVGVFAFKLCCQCRCQYGKSNQNAELGIGNRTNGVPNSIISDQKRSTARLGFCVMNTKRLPRARSLYNNHQDTFGSPNTTPFSKASK